MRLWWRSRSSVFGSNEAKHRLQDVYAIVWKFKNLCQKTARNIWKTNISLFSEHGVLHSNVKSDEKVMIVRSTSKYNFPTLRLMTAVGTLMTGMTNVTVIVCRRGMQSSASAACFTARPTWCTFSHRLRTINDSVVIVELSGNKATRVYHYRHNKVTVSQELLQEHCTWNNIAFCIVTAGRHQMLRWTAAALLMFVVRTQHTTKLF